MNEFFSQLIKFNVGDAFRGAFGSFGGSSDLRVIPPQLIQLGVGGISIEPFTGRDRRMDYYRSVAPLRTIIDSKVDMIVSGDFFVNGNPIRETNLKEPNGQTVFLEWIQKAVKELEVFGTLIIRNTGTQAFPSLDIYSVGRTEIGINRESNEFMSDYVKWIKYSTTTGKVITISGKELETVFIYNESSVDNVEGTSKIDTLQPVLDLLRMIEKASIITIKNRGQSGILTVSSSDGTGINTMSEKEIRRIQESVQRINGVTESRQTPIGFSNTPLSYVKLDVDYRSLELEAKYNKAFREIVRVYGLDEVLFGQSTFNNKEAAIVNVYSTSIIPKMTSLLESLSSFLNVEMTVTYAKVPAISKVILGQDKLKQEEALRNQSIVSQTLKNIQTARTLGIPEGMLIENLEQLKIEMTNG